MKFIKLGIAFLCVAVAAILIFQRERAPQSFIRIISFSTSLPVEKLYRQVHQANDHDVIALSAEKCSKSELQGLEKLYQHQKVWMTLNSKETTFYAGLFKQVKMEDVFENNLVVSLVELAGGHAKIFDKSLLRKENRRHAYAPASEIVKQVVSDKKADLVVFSFDRPLQLYAFLESVEKNVKGLNQTSVIYRSSNQDYEVGYEKVQQRFSQVQFLRQGAEPAKDFKPLFLKASFQSSAPYILYAVDDIIVKNKFDLETCMDVLEITGAYGFFLRLGKHIDYCYMKNFEQGVPPSWEVREGIFAWQFKMGNGDWKYPNSVDMSLYKKSDIETTLRKVDFHNPNLLESQWALKARFSKMGLYFEEAKIVNLPMNIVNQSNLWNNRNMQGFTTKDLLEKFQAGLKIDIRPFSKLSHRSVHIDTEVSFIAQNDE
jgi:hypothetical protein